MVTFQSENDRWQPIDLIAVNNNDTLSHRSRDTAATCCNRRTEFPVHYNIATATSGYNCTRNLVLFYLLPGEVVQVFICRSDMLRGVGRKVDVVCVSGSQVDKKV